MSDQRFILLVRQYNRNSVRFRRGYGEAIDTILKLRAAGHQQSGAAGDALLERIQSDVELVQREYGQNNPSWEGKAADFVPSV